MFIGGNWKLNGDKASLVKLADEINSLTQDLDSTTIAVFPPFVYLPEIIAQLNASHINVGAQNQAGFASGAYTGEIAASMLKDIGCEYVLLGHSERRHVYAESDEMINQKMHLAFENSLIPVLCVGETLDQRKSGDAQKVVLTQLQIAFEKLSEEKISSTVIAYEPVWAIGTGEVATPEQAQEMHFLVNHFVAFSIHMSPF